MKALVCLLLLLVATGADAGTVAGVQGPGFEIKIDPRAGGPQEMALALKIMLSLTLVSLAPSILIAMTAFTRIVVVLSLLRHAIGLQETPPNAVIVSLALFLTLFTMAPTLERVNRDAVQPFADGKLGYEAAWKKGTDPFREFMIRHTRESDLTLMVEASKSAEPKTVEDVQLVQLIPAFMLSELRTAFQIGFIIFLPFLLIDLIVSSALMALGMMMVPPSTISLPLKILMFVLIDGWNIVTKALLSTFG